MMLSQPWMVFIFSRKLPLTASVASITTVEEDEVTVTPEVVVVMVTYSFLL